MVESDTITRFETGFKEGVASVDSSIKVDVQYVGSYSDSAKVKQSLQLCMQVVLMLFTMLQVVLVLVSSQAKKSTKITS